MHFERTSEQSYFPIFFFNSSSSSVMLWLIFTLLWIGAIGEDVGTIGEEANVVCYNDPKSELKVFHVNCGKTGSNVELAMNWKNLTMSCSEAGSNKIIFSDCQMTDLPHNLFENLQNTSEIRMDNNGIESIERSKFPRDCSLQRLSLAHNSISELPVDWFINTTKLKAIDLSYNKIIKIHSIAFSGTEQSLEQLNLSGNRISLLNKETFANLTRLTELNLSHNSIKIVHFDANDLNTLDVSFNSIQRLYDDSFEKMPHLQRLYLNNNQVSVAAHGALAHLANLTGFDISYNNLTEFDFEVLLPNSKQLIEIDLTGNRLKELIGLTEFIFPMLTSLAVSNNEFSCRYLIRFFRDHSGLVPLMSESLNKSGMTNIHGVTCELEIDRLLYENESSASTKDYLLLVACIPCVAFIFVKLIQHFTKVERPLRPQNLFEPEIITYTLDKEKSIQQPTAKITFDDDMSFYESLL